MGSPARRTKHSWSETVALVAVAAQTWWFARFELIDDAYISFRYAENLLAGNGLVFNVGERVEGYTNFLWVLLLAGAGGLGLPLELASRLLGAAAVAVTALVTGRLLAGTGRHLPALVFAACIVPAFWAVHGLETALFGMFLALGVHADLARTDEARPKAPVPASLWFGLAALTRPEGWLLFAARTAFLVVTEPSRRNSWRAWRQDAWFFALAAPHLVFRVLYYGSWLPNTYFAKVEPSSLVPVRGAHYVGSYFAGWGLPLAVVLGLGLLEAGRRPALRLIAWMAISGLAIVALEGGDAFFGFRFVAPLTPLLAVLTAGGAHTLTRGFGRIGLGARATALATAAVVSAVALHSAHAGHEVMREARIADTFTRDMKAVGQTLRDRLPADTTIALNPVGAVPWRTGFHTYDMLGLTDPVVARTHVDTPGSGSAGHEGGNGAYILDQEPDLLLLGNVLVLERLPPSPHHIRWPLTLRSEHEIAADPRTTRDYAPGCLPLEDGRVVCFLRKRSVVL